MARTPARPVLPVAVRTAYDLWLWLDERVGDFAVRARPNLGRRILDTAIDLVEALTDATYSPRASATRLEALRVANRRVALLRLLIRGAADRRYLSHGQRDFAVEKLVLIGRMLGSWLRSLERSDESRQ